MGSDVCEQPKATHSESATESRSEIQTKCHLRHSNDQIQHDGQQHTISPVFNKAKYSRLQPQQQQKDDHCRTRARTTAGDEQDTQG